MNKKIRLFLLLPLFSLVFLTGCVTTRNAALGTLTESNSRRVNDSLGNFSLQLPEKYSMSELTESGGTRTVVVGEGDAGQDDAVIVIQESDTAIDETLRQLEGVDGQQKVSEDVTEIAGYRTIKVVFLSETTGVGEITVYLIDTPEKNYTISTLQSKPWPFFTSVVMSFDLVK